MNPDVKTFFDEATFTASHVVSDPATGKAAIIDPVLDFDAASGRSSTRSADAIIDYVSKEGLDVDWILETHVHADHLTAAPYLKEKLGGKTGIGDKVGVIQKTFGEIFNAE
ncbi:MAG: MBL fold metallo-hydrolase, partial [Hyphococcus sp.]